MLARGVEGSCRWTIRVDWLQENETLFSGAAISPNYSFGSSRL